jgi:hypothetical protein
MGTSACDELVSGQRKARGACEFEEPFRKDPSQELLDQLPNFLNIDQLATEIKEGLLNPAEYPDPTELSKWSLRDGVLWRSHQLYIPEQQSLRLAILAKHHDDPLAGHFASRRTLELVARKFYWPGMNRTVDEYCRACFT